MTSRWPAWLLLSVALIGLCASVHAAEPRAELTVDPLEGTVGDPLQATLTIDLPAEISVVQDRLGPQLGDFTVENESWNGPTTTEEGSRWIWTARLSAFRTGELELPAIVVPLQGEEAGEIATEPLAITISSVLSDEDLVEPEPEIADLKDPASIAPELRPLYLALGLLLLLLAGAALLWWLNRRYGAKLAAAEMPDDPFQRTPPHVWVYGELQKLLDRRLPEQGQVDLFYAELARILKLYLGGRYRVDLLERISEEVPELLRQAGAAIKPIEETRTLLARSDQVKFARELPPPAAWKEAIEQVYRVVDTTKPVEPIADFPSQGAA